MSTMGFYVLLYSSSPYFPPVGRKLANMQRCLQQWTAASPHARVRRCGAAALPVGLPANHQEWGPYRIHSSLESTSFSI